MLLGSLLLNLGTDPLLSAQDDNFKRERTEEKEWFSPLFILKEC
jgi:hypothetical protein